MKSNTCNTKRPVVELLKQVWNDLTKEFGDYYEVKEIKMYWHENDLRLHLGHRLMAHLSKIGEYEVHANVLLHPKYFKGRLHEAMEKALRTKPFIRKYYVDLVVNLRQDISNPFVLCTALKYYYYRERHDRIQEQLEKDLERLAIIKKKGVAEEIACLMLNVQYEPGLMFMQKLERKLEYYERELGLIGLVHHYLI